MPIKSSRRSSQNIHVSQNNLAAQAIDAVNPGRRGNDLHMYSGMAPIVRSLGETSLAHSNHFDRLFFNVTAGSGRWYDYK